MRKDLTSGPVHRHLFALAGPIAWGSFVQSLNSLLDLYFVAALGANAVAGVGAGSTISFFLMACTQSIGTGTGALIAHGAGRRDFREMASLFHQALLVGIVAAAVLALLGYALARQYLALISADEQVQRAGEQFLYALLPGLAILLPTSAVNGLLRGMGEQRAMARVQSVVLILNLVLSPVLITGLGSSFALGVVGAGLARTLSMLLAFFLLLRVAIRHSELQLLSGAWFLRPDLATLSKLLRMGLPAGGEFVVTFGYIALLFWAAGHWGSAVQAGVQVNNRLLQTFLLPAFAATYAAATIVGHNFGARQLARARETFGVTLGIESALMLALALIFHSEAERMVGFFSHDPQVILQGAMLLQISAWSFVAQGIVQTCSGVFQGIGRTTPAFVSAVAQLGVFAIGLPWFLDSSGPADLWIWAAVCRLLQALLSLLLLRGAWPAPERVPG